MRRLADLVVRWPWAVIGVWVALAVALPLSFPSLGEMAEKHPLAILPSDAPSSVTALKMNEAFHEPGNDNLLLIALINENGLGPADEATYRKLVDAVRDDVTDVVSVQDFVSTPQLRQFLTSEDKTTWVLPVGLAGELGTPRAFDSFNRVTDIVEHNVVKQQGADGPLAVHLTGPAATVADLTVAGQRDRLPIELAIAVLVLAVLLLVYRSAVTMLLPLVTIGSSLVIAQAAVAGFSQLTGSGVSNQSIVFLSAIMAGAGTDYAVFLISRYHDYVRSGADSDHAVKAAMISIGKVITASATTVGITFLLLSFAKMGVFRTVGISSAIGIGVAYPRRGDSAAGNSGARRAAWLGQATARTDRSILATFGHPDRAPAGGTSGCQCARLGPPGQLRDLRQVQLRRSQGRGGVGAEFGRVRRAGTPFPHQSVHPRIHPRPVTA